MSDRWWTALLVYPAPLYAGGLVLVHFGFGDIAFPLGFLLAFGFGSATGFGFLRHPTVVWSGRFFFVLAALLPIAYGPFAGSVAIEFAAGVALGSPFLWLEYTWRESASPGARVLALESALLIGVLAVATFGVAPGPNGGAAGWQFLQALGQVVSGQVQGVASVLTGTMPSSMPLESAFDAGFVALGALALAGVLLSWVSPRTALDDPLPWSWVRNRPSLPIGFSASEELGLRPGQRDAIATRTLPHPPEAMLAPGFGPLVLASLLVVGYLVLAVAAPTYALLAGVLSTVGAVTAVALVLARRLTPIGGLAT